MLILIAHGSRDPRWRDSVQRLADTLEADLGRDAVRLAYMEKGPPTLMDVVSEAVGSGADRIRVLPLFMASQGHVEGTIVPMVDQLRESLGSIEVELLPPVGQHPSFLKVLREIWTEGLE